LFSLIYKIAVITKFSIENRKKICYTVL
jgi:hypothetical protein